MAKKRTPEQNRAIYERRVARAKAEGFSGYGQARRAEGRTAEQYRAAVEAARAKGEALRRQVHELAEGKLVTTTTGLKGWAVIRGQLAGHGTRPVVMRVVLKDGTVKTVWGGGQSAALVRKRLGTAGQLDKVADEVNAVERYSSAPISASDIASVQFELKDEGV